MKILIKLSRDEALEEVIDKPVAIVGRSSKCDVVVQSEVLSRQHCQVELDKGQFFVTDLGSANGVFIDGTRIKPNERTAFNTFLQLAFGPLEVMLSDTEDLSSPGASLKNTLKAPQGSSNPNDQLTGPTRHINSRALKESMITAPRPLTPGKTADNKSGLMLSTIFFVGVLGYFGWVLVTEEPEVKVSVTPKVNPSQAAGDHAKKPPLKLAPDAFLPSSDYQQKYQNKGCAKKEICSSFTLVESDGEGYVQDQSEYIIYLNPQRLVSLPQFSNIQKLPDSEALISIYLLLRSQLFYQLTQKEVSQIHLVFLNPEKHPYKVYRSHISLLTPEFDRLQSIAQLAEAIRNGNSQPFWESNQKYFPFQDLI